MSRLREVVVEARAKLNLGLAVGPPRGDGYHDIVTIFQSISLSDTLIVSPRARGFSLAVRHEDASIAGGASIATADVPTGADNIVLRAARALSRHAKLDAGARFTLIKRIPSRAGLGGASADAAAALAGLAALHSVRLARRERLALAAALGSDVPFMLSGGTALGRGRGEQLQRLELDRPFEAIVAVPRWRVSTALAYARIDQQKNPLTVWRSKLVSAETLGRKQVRAAAVARFGNSFEHVLGRNRRAFESLRSRLRDLGLTGVQMTGSGSAVFGLVPPKRKAVEVVRRFEGVEALYAVRSVRTGMRVSRLP
jgi:4-diphosphocytidyl-2-C-methyl-D-erythritol kinase